MDKTKVQPFSNCMLRRNVYLSYSILFLIVSMIVLAPFYLHGISLIWMIDGMGQYYPAFLYTGKWLREFFGSLLHLHPQIKSFDLGIAMGESVVGTLNYYGFGDPLNLLSVFSNLDNGAYVFSFMYVLRLYLAGLSFIVYGRYMQLDDGLTKIAAVCYAFSGYALYGVSMYIEFSAPLIYLPLLLCGCEMVWKKKRYTLLILSALYASLCNLYFLYMVCLFLVFYCIVRCCFLYGRNIKKILAACLKCAAAFLAGFLLSLPVSMIFIRCLLGSDRSEVSILRILLDIRRWIPHPSYIKSYFKGIKPSQQYWSNIPIIECLVLIYALFQHKTRRERQCAIAVWTGSILAVLPITNAVFSGFSSSYDRWHFLLIFSFLVVFVMTAEQISRKLSGNRQKYFLCAAGAGCIINVSLGGLLFFSALYTHFSVQFIPLADAKMYVDSPVNYAETIQADNAVFRISNDSLTGINKRPENVAMLNDYYGLTYWWSVINKNAQEIVDRLDTDKSKNWRSYGLENNELHESMAAVKYYLWKDNQSFPSSYEYMEQVDFYGTPWKVYRNPNALPIIYSFDEAYFEKDLFDQYYKGDIRVLEHASGAAQITVGADTISADVDLSGASYVMLAIPYSSGWRAYVDGRKEPVIMSDILYMAVRMPAGTHHIEFQYSPYL